MEKHKLVGDMFSSVSRHVCVKVASLIRLMNSSV